MAKLDNTEVVLRDLHPLAKPAFEQLTIYLEQLWKDGKTQTFFKPFEGLRTPIKQLELLNRRPVVTHVGPWQSAHQYGLAVDFVPWSGNAFSWDEDHDFTTLRLAAVACGLSRPMEWDKCHIEHPAWAKFQGVIIKTLTLPKPANDNVRTI